MLDSKSACIILREDFGRKRDFIFDSEGLQREIESEREINSKRERERERERDKQRKKKRMTKRQIQT